MIIWGIIAILIGWYLFKWALAVFGAGLGILFGVYVWDSSQGKFVKKE